MIRKTFCLLIIAFMVAAPVLAQQKEGITAKVYEVRNRRVDDIAKLLVGLDVDLVNASINPAFNTFTVRASEQGHATVAELIRKYDIPIRTIEFQFFLIKATTSGEGLKDGIPERIQRALKDVALLTRYKGFELIDAPFIRTKEGVNSASLDGRGIYSYDLSMMFPQITTEETKRQISISSFFIRFNIPAVNPEGKSFTRNVALNTPFSIFEGEIVALGASQIEREGKDPGSAIITVVTAKIL
jgi:hypothetical protein